MPDASGLGSGIGRSEAADGRRPRGPRSRASARSLLGASLLTVCALLTTAGAASAGRSVLVRLHPIAGARMTGAARLTAGAGGTRVSLDLRGLPPHAVAHGFLHAGSCSDLGHLSASFALLPRLRAGATGRARATGRVRFHVRGENVPLSAVVDGGHVIVIVLRRVVACGTIARPADRSITQRSIGGARLGRTKAAYIASFGTPFRVDRIERGLNALVFTRIGVTVHLKFGSGVAITTISRRFRTRAGVGPCAPARTLTAAYGDRLRKLPTTGPVALYRLGNLVFRVDRPHRRVGAVTLGRGKLAVLIAGNSSDCGAH